MTNFRNRTVRAACAALTASAFCAALAVVTPTTAYGFHGEPEIFPAYYDGTVVSFMMGPSGNSANPNQVRGGGPNCFGLGPNMSTTSRNADVPVMYAIYDPAATQMSCPDGSLKHDMVLTAIPGDRGYQPAVRISRCTAGPNFALADFPFTSAAEVHAGIQAGHLTCSAPGAAVRMAPVVGRPTGEMHM